MLRHLTLLLVVIGMPALVTGCGKSKGKKDRPAVTDDAQNIESEQNDDPTKGQGDVPDAGNKEPSDPPTEPMSPIVGSYQDSTTNVTLSINPDLIIETNLVLTNPLGFGSVITPEFPQPLALVENQESTYKTVGSYYDTRGYSRIVELELHLHEDSNSVRVLVSLPNSDLNQFDCYDCCNVCVQPDPFPVSPGSSVRFEFNFARLENPVPPSPSK